MQKAFEIRGLEFSERALEGVPQLFSCASINHLYVALGEGFGITASEVFYHGS